MRCHHVLSSIRLKNFKAIFVILYVSFTEEHADYEYALKTCEMTKAHVDILWVKFVFFSKS